MPEHFLNLDIQKETPVIQRISRWNHGEKTLLKIKELARNSIGIDKKAEEENSRLILDSWISQIRQVNKNILAIGKAMIQLAQKSEYFEILTSLMGISDISAAQFIGECRELKQYKHYKQIEKLAGLNLRLSDSGKYVGARRISGIGNRRLSRLIYYMTAQTVRFIPEVRIKFLKRQLKKRCYRKNIVASSSNLLKLLMALIKDKRSYEFRKDRQKELSVLEQKYQETLIKKTQKTLKEAA